MENLNKKTVAAIMRTLEITEEELVKANLSLNYFEREVVEIWGEGINKLGIVLKGEK